jgi:hypothetical protein
MMRENTLIPDEEHSVNHTGETHVDGTVDHAYIYFTGFILLLHLHGTWASMFCMPCACSFARVPQ